MFKNYKKLGIIIPEFEGLEKGFCEISVDISYNGEVFSSKKSFKFLGKF